MNQPGFKEIFAYSRDSFEYALDRVILRFTKKVAEILKENGLSKRDLAAKVGCTPPNISKVFSGSPNLTVASMLKIARAVDCELQIELRPKTVDHVKTTTNFSVDASAFANRLLVVEFSEASTETAKQQISTEKGPHEFSVAA
jgi:transcriptional regulator with XRE-family HTH domain